MSIYRICIESYGGPIGYCDSEFLYTKWYPNLKKTISDAHKIERPKLERSVKIFLQEINDSNGYIGSKEIELETN